ncbi:MAG TPA: hypothetical protein VH575_11470 [Gemmataceae bacterium]|jgi:hypothetical protein
MSPNRFDQASRYTTKWKDALKEWNVIESQQVLEWMAMGEAKGAVKNGIDSLLRVLARRFPPGATPDMEVAIRTTVDLERLGSWLDLAVTTNSLDAFRQTAGL